MTFNGGVAALLLTSLVKYTLGTTVSFVSRIYALSDLTHGELQNIAHNFAKCNSWEKS